MAQTNDTAATVEFDVNADLPQPEGPTIKLVSVDDHSFIVSRKVIEMSQTVKDMLSDMDVDEMPVPQIKGEILEKVVKWCIYHTIHPDTPVPETDKYRTDNIIAWDLAFMKTLDIPSVFKLTLAANYLNANLLLQLCLKTIANMMKGKTPDEIKEMFAVPESMLAEFPTMQQPQQEQPVSA